MPRRRRVPSRWPRGLVELGPGVFAYLSGSGEPGMANAGLVTSDEGVLLVDSLLPAFGRALRRAVRRASRAPVRYVVNTHYHIDHMAGNGGFPRATVIAHAQCRREALEIGSDMEMWARRLPRFADDLRALQPRLPSLTYEDRMVLYLGRREVHLLHLGRAHTRGDTLVYLPQEKVLFAGDVVCVHVVSGPPDAHVTGWLRVLDRLGGLDVEMVVPGHGPVADRKAISEMRELLSLLRREARKAYREGLPPAEAARRLRLGGYFGAWAGQERIPVYMERIYMELRGEL